jgi:hypothetical protein
MGPRAHAEAVQVNYLESCLESVSMSGDGPFHASRKGLAMFIKTALVLTSLLLLSAAQPPQETTRSIDVRELLTPIPDFGPRQGGLQRDPREETEQGPTAAELEARLLTSLALGLGQTGARFEVKEGQLIATGSNDELLALEKLVARLKQQRAVQINVEARVLSLTDKDLQSLPDELRARIAEASIAPQPLDNQSVQRLLEPLRQATGSSALTAPNLTLFNQQQASVQVTTSESYIADFARNEQGEMKPLPDSVWSGIQVEIRAASNADGSEVSAAVKLVMQRLIILEDLKVEGTDLVKQVPKVERIEVDRQMAGLQTVLVDAKRLEPGERADAADAQPQTVLYLVRLTPIVVVEKRAPDPATQPPAGR